MFQEAIRESSILLILQVKDWVLYLCIVIDKPYDIEDIIVSEYGTTVVGLEMMRAVHEENAEEDRKQQVVKSAFNTLIFLRTGGDHPHF